MTKEQELFISNVGTFAKSNMKESKILASVTIAQAILESGWGKSRLALEGNNLFGIKGDYNGESIIIGSYKYRKYPSFLESLKDHSNLLTSASRYKNLIGETNYRTACTELMLSGYCSEISYPGKLVKIIELYDLTKYDEIDNVESNTVIENNNLNNITKTNINLNGVIKEVDVIMVNGNNYIKLRDIHDDYIDIDYQDGLPAITAVFSDKSKG